MQLAFKIQNNKIVLLNGSQFIMLEYKSVSSYGVMNSWISGKLVLPGNGG